MSIIQWLKWMVLKVIIKTIILIIYTYLHKNLIKRPTNE